VVITGQSLEEQKAILDSQHLQLLKIEMEINNQAIEMNKQNAELKAFKSELANPDISL